MAGVIAGRWRVMGPLGSGILGYVMRVRDETSGDERAMKLFKPQEISESSRGRFEREFAAISRIAHPHVVRVHEWGVHGERPYFVMDLLRGVPLGVFAAAERPAVGAPGYARFASRTTEVFRQIAEALAAVHAAGVVHRDVKPDNVLVEAGDPPYATLLDFGHAKDEDLRDLTTTGTVVGSAAYIAPESADGEAAGPPADLYALGCVLFDTLVGRAPFVGTTVVEVLLGHLRLPAPDPRDVDPRVPAPLAELCLALMRKSPAERPSSAAEVATTLAGIGSSYLT